MDNTLNPCPHLRIKNDPDTYCAYPSRANFCHHAKPQQAVAPLYQENVCLHDIHVNCPVYKHEGLWPGKLPDALRTDDGYKAALGKMAIEQPTASEVAATSTVVTPTQPLMPKANALAIEEAQEEPVAIEPPEATAVEEAPAETAEPEADEAIIEPVELEAPALEEVIETAPEAEPEPELVSESEIANQAVSPTQIAAEVFAGTRTNPPPVGSGGTAERIAEEKAAQKGQQRRLILWGGIGAGIILCLLVGIGSATMLRGMFASQNEATPTIAATPTDASGVAVTTSAPQPTQTITPSATSTTPAPDTPIPADPQPASMRFDTNMRSGPGTEYGVIGTITAGAPILVIGRDQLGVWLAIRLPTNQEGWVPASQVNSENINVLSAPLLEVTFEAQGTLPPQP